MKRSVILLLIILLAQIKSFSQTTSIQTEVDSIVTITTEELKIANLIFVEHSLLLKEKELLNEQIKNYLSKTHTLKKQVEIVAEQKDIVVKQLLAEQEISRGLQKKLNQKNKIIKGLSIGGVSVTVGLILFLVLK